jgi:predicted transcriptional regulator
MAEQIKFTEEEVSKINELRQNVANLFTQLGQLQIEKKRRLDELEKIESNMINQHLELQKTEEELFKGLNEKYGDGNYDPTTNTFTPLQTTSEEVIG